MRGLGRREPASRLLRPIARVADGIAYNRERRRTIQRYRRVACVALVGEHDEMQPVTDRVASV
jgi:hypothetical protein